MQRFSTMSLPAALAAAVAGGAVLGQHLPEPAPARNIQLIQDRIHDDLAAVLDGAGDDEVVSTLVLLDHQVDIQALDAALTAARATRHERITTVVSALQEMANQTQPDLVAHLTDLLNAGRIASFLPFWISNEIRVDAVKAEIFGLAAHPDVRMIYLNYPIELVEPVEPDHAGALHGAGSPIAGGQEPGVQAVRAPEVWQMGFTGEGVLVASLDTGVDGNHVALAGRWAGVADPNYAGHPEWAFFDPNTFQTFPFDSGIHGTHTMGSVCGGAPGDEIGVAPGAYWITAAVIDIGGLNNTIAKAHLAFQWMLNPDGNPNTTWDVPHVCSNSWGLADAHGVPDCDPDFWAELDACEAAGTVIIFSAGNEGSSGLRRPADRATDDYRTFAVAAVDANNPSWPIAGFSSRGPTFCTGDGSPAIKPDIAAPGVNVRSSVPGNGYSFLSGTSMASPHVNGVVALMRQANPDLPVDQIKQIIYDTAFDLGSPGEDNSYGWGMVDAFEAVSIALSMATLTIDFPEGRPSQIDPAGGDSFPVVVTGQQSQPQPGTGLLWVDDGNGFVPYPMLEDPENTYEAVFPPTTCNTTVRFYVSVETTKGELVTSPFNAPDSSYGAFSISDIAELWHDDFETNMGWTVTGDAVTGMWERGVPIGGGDRADPPTDADGSGQCYVTDNRDGDFDIDGGSTTLTSPLMDATGGDEVYLSYWRWYHNSFGNAPESDIFVVEISNNGGSSWINLEIVGPSGPEVHGGWIRKSFRIADVIPPTSQMRIRFTASDLGEGSVVEAGVDGVKIEEFVCDDTNLTDLTVVDGTLIAGGVPQLVQSDDQHVHTRSTPGFSAFEPNVMSMLVGATGNTAATTIDLAVESRINNPSGTAKVSLRNWSNNLLDLVGTYSIGVAETTQTFNGIDATNHVRGDGRIEVEIRHVVIATLSPIGFDSFVDQLTVASN